MHNFIYFYLVQIILTMLYEFDGTDEGTRVDDITPNLMFDKNDPQKIVYYSRLAAYLSTVLRKAYYLWPFHLKTFGQANTHFHNSLLMDKPNDFINSRFVAEYVNAEAQAYFDGVVTRGNGTFRGIPFSQEERARMLEFMDWQDVIEGHQLLLGQSLPIPLMALLYMLVTDFPMPPDITSPILQVSNGTINYQNGTFRLKKDYGIVSLSNMEVVKHKLLQTSEERAVLNDIFANCTDAEVRGIYVNSLLQKDTSFPLYEIPYLPLDKVHINDDLSNIKSMIMLEDNWFTNFNGVHTSDMQLAPILVALKIISGGQSNQKVGTLAESPYGRIARVGNTRMTTYLTFGGV